MNPQRDGLPEALRELALAAPEASAELGTRLDSAFAHHHAQRRLRRVVAVAALVGCLAIAVYWLQPHRAPQTAKIAAPAAQTAQAPSPASSAEPKIVIPQSPRPAAPSIARASGKPRVHAKVLAKPGAQGAEATPENAGAGDFVALSTFDPAVPLGGSRMVRMDLPGSALQLIGYPVDGQLLDRRIVTDVLVGQDGMPYAVRLVQTRNVH